MWYSPRFEFIFSASNTFPLHLGQLVGSPSSPGMPAGSLEPAKAPGHEILWQQT